MSEDYKKLEQKVMDLENKLNGFILNNQVLEDRIKKLEESEKNTGVFLDGAPDYVVEYVTKEEKKEGE